MTPIRNMTPLRVLPPVGDLKPWRPKHLKVWTPEKPVISTPHNQKVNRPMSTNLTAKALKVTLVVDPHAVESIPVGPTTSRVDVQIAVGGRTVKATLAGKSVRKARITILEHGVDNVAAILQGKLEACDVLTEAGLVVQVKAPKPVSEKPAEPIATAA